MINEGKLTCVKMLLADYKFRCGEKKNLLTDAWYDVELVVDLLVHGRGDDADFREGIGHRVDTHLCH